MESRTSIQNSLLTVINEKVYRNGQYTIQLPLKGLIAASNELPAQGEGLESPVGSFLNTLFYREYRTGIRFRSNDSLCQ